MTIADRIKKEFDSRFPFSVLSNVILYRNDRGETDLYANEIDYLFHYFDDDSDILVIVESKEGKIIGSDKFSSPTETSLWQMKYPDKLKDIKKQVLDQRSALKQFCFRVSKTEPEIECWIVDRREVENSVIIDDKHPKIKLLTYNGLNSLLENINSVVPIEQSTFLRELRKGIISPDIGHPEMRNAIRFVSICRERLDEQIFRFFKPKKEHYAVNGCAGMGKSVLLAYCIYVFATDQAVKIDNPGMGLTSHKEQSGKLNLPDHTDRRIFVYAVKQKQVEILEGYWEKIKKQIRLMSPMSQPAMQNPVFDRWKGEIPEECNVLVIDEAHDLSDSDQEKITKWYEKSKKHRYLLVACDRNQALRRGENEEGIIKGINFSLHSTRLNRIYRCPFPVYVASIGLLFRWFLPTGPRIQLSTQKLRENFGFNPSIIEDDKNMMILTMRNDSHPGNNWKQSVSVFNDCTSMMGHLCQFGLDRKDVLWAQFKKTDPDYDYEEILKSFTWVDLTGANIENEIDNRIKGQEFAIVVIEGLPDVMNPKTVANEEQSSGSISQEEMLMWRMRRNLYITCSRAYAFLYFVEKAENANTTNQKELKVLIDQVSRPIRGEHESGQTWEFRIPTSGINRKPLIFRDLEVEEGDKVKYHSKNDNGESSEWKFLGVHPETNEKIYFAKSRYHGYVLKRGVNGVGVVVRNPSNPHDFSLDDALESLNHKDKRESLKSSNNSFDTAAHEKRGKEIKPVDSEPVSTDKGSYNSVAAGTNMSNLESNEKNFEEYDRFFAEGIRKNYNSISIGDEVKIEFDGKTYLCSIDNGTEFFLKKRKIGASSVIGKKLIGASEGDTVEVELSGSPTQIKIFEINKSLTRNSHDKHPKKNQLNKSRPEIVKSNIPSAKKHLNIDSQFDYTNSKPTELICFGNRYNPETWKQLLVIVSEEIYRRNQSQFHKCLELRGTKMKYFSKDQNELKLPEQISNSRYYVETYFSANSIVKRCSDILKLFGYSAEHVKISASAS